MSANCAASTGARRQNNLGLPKPAVAPMRVSLEPESSLE